MQIMRIEKVNKNLDTQYTLDQFRKGLKVPASYLAMFNKHFIIPEFLTADSVTTLQNEANSLRHDPIPESLIIEYERAHETYREVAILNIRYSQTEQANNIDKRIRRAIVYTEAYPSAPELNSFDSDSKKSELKTEPPA